MIARRTFYHIIYAHSRVSHHSRDLSSAFSPAGMTASSTTSSAAVFFASLKAFGSLRNDSSPENFLQTVVVSLRNECSYAFASGVCSGSRAGNAFATELLFLDNERPVDREEKIVSVLQQRTGGWVYTTTRCSFGVGEGGSSVLTSRVPRRSPRRSNRRSLHMSSHLARRDRCAS